MKAGSTFVFVGGTEDHLWMIVSDPEKDPSRVLIVNFTSWKPYHDLTLVLEGGEHRFIRHRTCVNYPQARVLSLAELHRLEENGLLSPDDNLAPSLLQLIRNRAAESRRMSPAHFEILENQELVQYDDLE